MIPIELSIVNWWIVLWNLDKSEDEPEVAIAKPQPPLETSFQELSTAGGIFTMIRRSEIRTYLYTKSSSTEQRNWSYHSGRLI